MAKLVVLQQASPRSPKLSSLLPSSLSEFNGSAFRVSIKLVQSRRKAWQPNGSFQVTASSAKKILIMGGTRFIGVFLTRLLVKEGHQVTLFTRGKVPITQQLPRESDQEYEEFKSKVLHLKGDRKDSEFVKSSLAAEGFEVVYDINGREAVEAEPILDALPKLEQYIYCSSAGVYLKSDLLPHFESDAVDPKSRHKGKLETENLLDSKGVNWTSLRPVYIYGPLNYNPVEEWFFHRLKAGRPIPIPNSGVQVTQLGHVKDLADAFVKVLSNPKASKQVYNISGSKYVTFDGLARACAKAAGYPEPEIIHYNPKEFDFGKKKAFPFRDQHFFASIEKAQTELNWKPQFGLIDGLVDSYNSDFGLGNYRKAADFSTDDIILVFRRNILSSLFAAAIFPQLGLSKVTIAEPANEFKEYIDIFDGYSLLYPKNWIQVRGAGADIFFRDPFVLDENLSVELSSPSSSRYMTVEDLGSPESAAEKVLKQYLTEFMSTRLGVRRESSILSASSRVADDGKLYYQIEVNIKSYANNNELAVMPQDRIARLEWERRYLSVLGVGNSRLYELRLQTPESVFVEEEKDLRQVMDSFRVINSVT